MIRTMGRAKVLGVAALMGAMAVRGHAQATLTIDAGKTLAKVSPTLYGLMTEEINYSYDGGLYGELLADRALTGGRGDEENWIPVAYGNAKGTVGKDRTVGPSVALPLSMKITVEKADAANAFGIRNHGFWGVPVRPNTTYQGSVWAKSDAAGGIKVNLVSNDSGKGIDSAALALTTEWKQYTFTFKSGNVAASADNSVMVTVDHPGTVWFQLLSLFPPTYHDRANGNRVDLMEMMAAMHPAFLRFPGGNYLEGDHIADRFDWKKTIGPWVDRPTHASPWKYQSMDGMGLLEFLEWCEDLKMQPVLAVYAGYSLQQDVVKTGADLEPYVQDALDEIEYVTGDATTKWGAERVKDGHPAAFPLNYVEIGNEDNFDRSRSYDARYAQFYDAIKKKYPSLQLIATMRVKGHVMDVVDDHFYRKAEQFFADTHHYDQTDRNGPKIFVGEWATREGMPTPNMGAALGDAAWMTGMERNSDVVLISSYAPLLVNVNPNGMQWQADLIGYDAMTSYGSPSYYAQAMFASHVGTEIVASELKGAQGSAAPDRLFYSVTKDAAKGIVYLKLVNASSAAQPLKISLDGVKDVKGSAKLISLSGATTAETNTITDPRRVAPVESVVKGVGKSFERTLPGYSVEVLEISIQ